MHVANASSRMNSSLGHVPSVAFSGQFRQGPHAIGLEGQCLAHENPRMRPFLLQGRGGLCARFSPGMERINGDRPIFQLLSRTVGAFFSD